MLQVLGISKRYGSIHALSDVSVEVGAGEIVAVVGENGAGKSTLVRCIARSVSSDSGRISLDGSELRGSPRDAIQQGLSVVWQDLALCENLDVTANLFLGREMGRGPRLRQAAMRSRATQVFADLNVEMPDLDRPIERLSGGQRQLVAIARATLDLPKVLILDEPTAALGIAESRTVLGVVKTLRARGVATLLISHQLDEVFEVADRIVVLRHGRLVADLHRLEAHPDDVVALITGVDVDSTASQQLRRLHSLAEQLADADLNSILPLTVSSLSSALNVEQLAIFSVPERPLGPVLCLSASLNLPPSLEEGLQEVSLGEAGGFLGTAASEASLIVIPRLANSAQDPVARMVSANGILGAWASPVVGQSGTLAVIVGFTDSVAQLKPDQVQLLELFSTMAAASIERGELIESLHNRNQSLEGLQGVLETLAGPDSMVSGMSSALVALRRGVGCEVASLFVQTSAGSIEERGSSSVLGEEESVVIGAKLLKIAEGKSPPPDVLIERFDWAHGSAVIACFWREANSSEQAIQLMQGAANSFRLALERELVAEVEQEAAALHRSRAMERELVRRLSHELRTPLTAIRGFSSTMLQSDVEWPESEKQRFLKIIESESGRMGRLVARLIDDSAIEFGTLHLDHNYCDLVAVVDQAASVAGPAELIRLSLPRSFTVWGDKDRLQQVFVNLVGNALRHNPEGTSVDVRLVELGDRPGWVLVEVVDDGAGLPGHVLDYLNGVQGEVALDGGLGIRLARGFVRAHGGTIAATSSAGGTRITVELLIEPETE